jgi:hypothetical protein
MHYGLNAGSEMPLMQDHDGIQHVALNDQPMSRRGWSARRWRCAVVLTSAILFIVSLTQIVCVTDLNSCEDCGLGSQGVKPGYLHGWEALTIGLGGVLEGINLLLWPLVVAAWVFACCKRPIATLIAVSLIAWLVSDLKSETSHTAGYAAWLANPIIALTWLLYRYGVSKPKEQNTLDARFAVLISAVTALLLTFCFLWVQHLTVPPPYRGVNIPDFVEVTIIAYGIGYWLWVASAATLAAGVIADTFLFGEANSLRAT